MRFYRVFFWLAASYQIVWGGILMLAAPEATVYLGFNTQPPLYLVHVLGLFVGLLGVSYAYAAERPWKSEAIVFLGILANLLFPFFAWLAFLRGELRQGVLWVHLASSLVWLPFFVSYYFWLYRRPRPEKLIRMMGLFGSYFKNRR